MGKKRSQKDRAYITAKEHRDEWGGFKDKTRAPFARLPFNCCAITFTPFEDPVCTDDGTVYDIVSVVPFVRKFGRHPVKGTPLGLGDLIHLNFHKNADGEYACPVTGKVFTDHTHIVAVKPTGNVYAWEAVEELNVKAKNWKDLLTEEPFTRKDIIHLQDPLNLQGRLISDFDHVKRDLTLDDAEGEAPTGLRNLTDDMKRALGALGTAEAAEAMARGGGGKRAEAKRLLAEAKLRTGGGGGSTAAGASAGAAAGGGKATGSGAAAAATSGAAAGSGGADAGDAGGDWRLRGPAASRDMPAFKPGAVTWDTEDRGSAAAAAGKQQPGKKKSGGAATAGKPSAAAGADDPNAGKPNPKDWYESAGYVRYVTSHLTTGAMSRGFTSTVAGSVTRNERQMARRELTTDKKGYVRLHTNLGDLNIELHCDVAPRTCENFLGLCEMGYYDGVKFHRSIKNFMIQGGDPTGTGRGGESIYGPSFKDELDSRLLHSGRGVLSMANSGPGTNGSQFFILYKSAAHLNYKHSVFGRVVGGMDIITLMEKVPTDSDDRPLQDIVITGATVFNNPFKDILDEEKKQEEAEAKKAAGGADDPDSQRSAWYSNPAASHGQAAVRSGVGKYIADRKLDTPLGAGGAAAAAVGGSGDMAPPAAKKAKVQPSFGNFDAW